MAKRSARTHFLTIVLLGMLSCWKGGMVISQDNSQRLPLDAIPQGEFTSGRFTSSEIFPGTVRDYSVYVPVQYKPDQPASLMVFMDGSGYAKQDGAFRVPRCV